MKKQLDPKLIKKIRSEKAKSLTRFAAGGKKVVGKKVTVPNLKSLEEKK